MKVGYLADLRRQAENPVYLMEKQYALSQCSLSDGNYLIRNGVQPRSRSRSLIRAGYNIQIIRQDLASLSIRQFVIYFTKTGCQSIHVSVRTWPRISAQTAVHCLSDSVQLEFKKNVRRSRFSVTLTTHKVQSTYDSKWINQPQVSLIRQAMYV